MVPKGHWQARPGLTLLELSLVLLLIAILLGFSLPQFSRLSLSPLEQESRRLAETIRRTRIEAITQSRSFQLLFDLKAGSYKILAESLQFPGEFKELAQIPQVENPHLLRNGLRLVGIKAIAEADLAPEANPLQFEKIEFEAIFGQEMTLRIDDTGLTDLVSIKLGAGEDLMEVKVVSILGKVQVSPVKEAP